MASFSTGCFASRALTEFFQVRFVYFAAHLGPLQRIGARATTCVNLIAKSCSDSQVQHHHLRQRMQWRSGTHHQKYVDVIGLGSHCAPSSRRFAARSTKPARPEVIAIATMVALKRQLPDGAVRAGRPAKASKSAMAAEGDTVEVARLLLTRSRLINPPFDGILLESLSDCLQNADDIEAETDRLRLLLEALSCMKKQFPGSSLQQAVAERPALLTMASPPRVQAILTLLANSCLLPGRVIQMVAARPAILTDLQPEELALQVAHLKKETTPMGSQVACLWQKFPQSMWMSIAEVDERLAWLRGIGVPNDKIRFVYAREPVFTQPMSSFDSQLEFLTGLSTVAEDARGTKHERRNNAVGALLACKPQYFTMPISRMEKLRTRIEMELSSGVLPTAG